ncbi:DUF222 domain-containing protein [Amnibacterium sp.]|uniref:DUF222 domain-containing protein n=1 Tax=Amnibacterium sp. TaxID=1872496 RepID=UPI003F7C0A55
MSLAGIIAAEQRRVDRLAARDAARERDAARRGGATVRPLRPSPVRVDPVHVLDSEPIDPFWRTWPEEDPTPPEESSPSIPVDPWPLLPESVRILEVDGARLALVTERIWMGGTPALPELMVQRLHARLRTEPGDHHLDLRGCEQETRAWALAAAAAAGLEPTTWRLTVEAVERWAVDDAAAAHLPCAPNAKPDPDPLFEALAVVAEQQRWHNRSEMRRIVAAVAAWRIAQAREGAGAANTPYLNGFFQDLGLQLGTVWTTARNTVHLADRVERSLPAVWQRFLAAEVPWSSMRAVHAAMEGMDEIVLPAYDDGACTILAEVPAPQVRDALRRLAERLQASSADDRRARAMRRRSVIVEAGKDGMGWLHAYLPMEALLTIDRQLTKAAVLEHGRSGGAVGIGALRADLLQDGLIEALANDASREDALIPERRGVQAKVVVLLPAMTALGRSRQPAVLQGYGPIGIRTALGLAGTAKNWIRVLTDPFTGVPVSLGRERYRPTADMRTLLRVLDGGGRGPGRPCAPEQAEVDHNRSFWKNGEGGATAIDNLMLLSHFDHGLKTAGEIDVVQLADRTAIVTTSAGNRYVTRPLDPLGPTPVPPDLLDPDDCPF